MAELKSARKVSLAIGSMEDVANVASGMVPS